MNVMNQSPSGANEGNKVINFSVKKAEEANVGKRTDPVTFIDGMAHYREELAIPEDRGLAMADKVMSEYTNPDILIQDYVDREIKAYRLSGPVNPTEEELRVVTEKAEQGAHVYIESCRKDIVYSNTQNLISILAKHEETPTMYPAIRMYVYGQELIKRLRPQGVTNSKEDLLQKLQVQ
jgi:hypothetical protein